MHGRARGRYRRGGAQQYVLGDLSVAALQCAISLLLGAVFAGGAVGAPLFGWFADRNGRRAALQLSLLVLVVSSLAVASSPGVGWMTLFRFVSGLALGGYPPLAAAYLADLLPPQRLGTNMMLCAAFAFLGAPALIFLIRWLTPLAPLGIEGWRWALVVAAAFSTLTATLFFGVPESPRWLAAVGRNEEAEQSFRRFQTAIRETVEPFLCIPAKPARTSAIATDDAARPQPYFRPAAFLVALYGLGHGRRSAFHCSARRSCCKRDFALATRSSSQPCRCWDRQSASRSWPFRSIASSGGWRSSCVPRRWWCSALPSTSAAG
jgi:MFS family permease